MDDKMLKTDQIQKALVEAGFNPEEELLNLESSGSGFEVPRIRIEHKDSGKHRLYIDRGENYLGEDTQEETLPESSFRRSFLRSRTSGLYGQTVKHCLSVVELMETRW